MQGRTVARTSIVSHRQRLGRPNSCAALYDKLLDLKKNEAHEISTKDEKDATNIKFNLRKIAKKEGMTLGWDRNKDYSLLYLWLEVEEAK